MAEELPAEPALADAGLAHDRHQLAGTLLDGALEHPDQERLLELAADERGGVRARDVRAEAGSGTKRAVESERLRLALDRHGLEFLVVEDALRLPERLLRARETVHRRLALQAGGGVDDIARDDSLALFGPRAESDHCLTGADADTNLEREGRVVLVQLLDRLQDAEAGPDSALGVVLVRHGCAEHRHHRVPDELLDGAAVALDVLPQASVVGADAGSDVLGISHFRGGGEADQVAEEDGHDLALLLRRRCRLLGERSRAVGTEREFPWQFLPAGGARRHARSLRRTNTHSTGGPRRFPRDDMHLTRGLTAGGLRPSSYRRRCRPW